MPKQTLSVGLIGGGFMGKAHSNAWRQVGRFFDLPCELRLKTLCGRDSSATTAAAGTLGWEESRTDWRAVVTDRGIDLVDIATPNDLHAEIAVAAAKAGKAVLCEKPLGLNVMECERMVAAVEQTDVVNMVCHNYRRIPAVALAKRLIERGDLGDRLYHFRARYAQDWLLDPAFPLVWRLQAERAGSGAHGDIDTHLIDLGRYLVGEFREVCGLLDTFIRQRPLPAGPGGGTTPDAARHGAVTVDDAVSWIGRFANGAVANIEATRFAAGRKNHLTFEINGTRGSLAFDLEDMNRLRFYRTDDPADLRGFRDILVTESEHPFAGAWWPPGHVLGYEHTFVHTFADFVRAVAEGRSVHPTFADGLATQRVLTAVQESAQRLKWVTV